jgi:hypothetical protein
MKNDILDLKKSFDIIKFGNLREKLKITIAEISNLKEALNLLKLMLEKEIESSKKMKFLIKNNFRCLQLCVCLLEDFKMKSSNSLVNH